jgi:hypothetical protein
MSGVMSSTALLLINSGIVVGEFSCYSDVMYYLGTRIVRTGDSRQLFLKDVPQQPTYGESWESDHEIVKDWAKYHMKLPAGYKLYRYLT